MFGLYEREIERDRERQREREKRETERETRLIGLSKNNKSTPTHAGPSLMSLTGAREKPPHLPERKPEALSRREERTGGIMVFFFFFSTFF